MIACYAWSNMMIINAMNIKVNFYSDEEMDLFVRMTPGISRDTLALLKSKGIFSNIYFTETPRIYLYGFLQKKLKLGAFNYYVRNKKQYCRLLDNIVGDKRYDKILVAGFWNDSLYYIDYFAKYNPKIQIILYDEGGASYDNSKKNLCKYDCNKAITGWKMRVKRFFPEKWLEIKHKRKVKNVIFLYAPERYMKIDPRMEIIRIPLIDDENGEIVHFFRSDLKQIQEDFLLPYIKRMVYFVAMGNSHWLPDAEAQSLNIIRTMLENVNNHTILIKTHPNNTNNRMKFATELEGKVYIDRNNILFEQVYLNIDIENKIIVTYASSSAMYVKTMFGKEPYIILIYRLFHQYHEHGDKNAERYAQDLQELYVNKNRVLVPNTFDEFADMLKAAIKEIINY